MGVKMGTYTGTAANDTVTPYTVSAGVTVTGAPKPSIGEDTINGLGGDDFLHGGGGADTINGGDGKDSIGCNVNTNTVGPVTFTGTATFSGGSGNDIIFADFYGRDIDLSQATFLLSGGAGHDEIRAAMHFPEEVTGQYGAATDVLSGNDGNDTFVVQESSDQVVEKLGEGYDTVIVYNSDYALPANVERLLMDSNGSVTGRHGTGNDLDNVIKGTIYGGDVLDGGVGNDTIYGSLQDSYGGDTIHGGLGNDIIHSQDPQYGWGAGNRQNTFYGDGGDDRIFGANDVDWIDGGIGNDTLYGDLGNDTISGQDGNDQIYGGRSADDPADGPDTIYADAGNDNVWAGGGNDLVYGGSGDDNLYGQSGNDTIRGGGGNDRVYGGSGTDILYGDDGVDNVRGGGGADRCDGGTGNDRYSYETVSDSAPGTANRDVILAFANVGATVGDQIDLAAIDANTVVGGNQAFVFRGTAAISGAGQVNVVASGGDTLIRANIGGTLAPELEIVVQDGTATPGQWVAGDFIL
jgi:Ca2+-binding RTX toxin-like protein